MPQAQHLRGQSKQQYFTPVAACSNGDLVKLPDGKAGVAATDIAAGVQGAFWVDGVYKVTKHTAGALLLGGDVFWDVSASHAQHAPDLASTDYRIGITVDQDEPAADTTVNVDLNEHTVYNIELGGPDGGDWIAEELAAGVAGSVNAIPGGASIVITADNEVQSNCLRSVRTVLVSSKPIFECRMRRSATTDAANDVDFGLATGGHASDFETVADFAAFHMDGDDLNIDTHSDDGTTDRAPADSTIDHVEATFAEYWIDARDDTNVKFYVDGVLVDTSATKRILTAALARAVAAVVMIEKTTGTSVGGCQIQKLRVRCTSVE